MQFWDFRDFCGPGKQEFGLRKMRFPRTPKIEYLDTQGGRNFRRPADFVDDCLMVNFFSVFWNPKIQIFCDPQKKSVFRLKFP